MAANPLPIPELDEQDRRIREVSGWIDAKGVTPKFGYGNTFTFDKDGVYARAFGHLFCVRAKTGN